MVSLDFRTRTDDDIRSITTAEFFETELPALIEQRAELAIAGARELGVEPFAFETPSGTWTLALAGETLTVTRGDTGPRASGSPTTTSPTSSTT